MIAAAGIRSTARRVRQFHEDDAVVAWWRTRLRPVLAWLTPGRRRTLLAAAALYEAGRRIPHEMRGAARWIGQGGLLEILLVTALLLAVTIGVHVAAKHFARLPALVRRRPQMTLHLVFWGALVISWMVPTTARSTRVVLGAFILILPFLLWRLGYLLMSGQRGRMRETTARDVVMYLFPIWGGSNTPYGKGLDYLGRHEARTDDALARSQLAGVRLLVLAVCWRVALPLFDAVVYGTPAGGMARTLGGANLGLVGFTRLVGGAEHPSLVTAWLSLYAELVRRVLKLAADGHEVIGVLRLAGFHVFRNTYKPLLAETVVEFWNRYYYYFKELLAEFFFFPVFVRWFKRQPHLRMFAATMAAACVGNMYYHALQRTALLLQADLAGLWWSMHSRLFYCVLLALGIYVSMRREQARRGHATRGAPRPFQRARAILGVWTFFSLIHIWGVGGATSFTRRVSFFLSLFGIG
jgi:hypothetical protein